jgi:hypothetical protein
MTNKRGAPLGNKNALKHGFYSRDYRATDHTSLETADQHGLAEEISLVRLHLRNLSEHARNASTLAEYLDVLRVMGFYLAQLNHLVKTQVFLGKHTTGLPPDFEQALEEVRATWADNWSPTLIP